MLPKRTLQRGAIHPQQLTLGVNSPFKDIGPAGHPVPHGGFDGALRRREDNDIVPKHAEPGLIALRGQHLVVDPRFDPHQVSVVDGLGRMTQCRPRLASGARIGIRRPRVLLRHVENGRRRPGAIPHHQHNGGQHADRSPESESKWDVAHDPRRTQPRKPVNNEIRLCEEPRNPGRY